MSTITERVALGEAFMNENDPPWWREDTDRAISLDALDLSETDRCVLGQRCPLEVLAARVRRDVGDLAPDDFGAAYLAYAQHLSGLKGWEFLEWASALGFIAPDDDRAAWEDLTAEWKSVIRERREAATAAGEGKR